MSPPKAERNADQLTASSVLRETRPKRGAEETYPLDIRSIPLPTMRVRQEDLHCHI